MREQEPQPLPMTLTHDEIHAYAGYQNAPSHCHIRIFQQDGRTPVIIASELPDNPGTSITNLAEQLCAELIRAYFAVRFEHDEPVIWIEHYQRTPDELRRRWPEFSRVTFHSQAPRRVTVAGTDRLQLGRRRGRISPAPPSRRWLDNRSTSDAPASAQARCCVSAPATVLAALISSLAKR
jgi:hypothetical protein